MKILYLLLIILFLFKTYAFNRLGDSSISKNNAPKRIINSEIKTPTNTPIIVQGSGFEACKAQIMPSYINYSMGFITKKYNTYSKKKYFNLLAKSGMRYDDFKSVSPPSIIVVSAGNDNQKIEVYKQLGSEIFNMIVVGSLAPDGQKSNFSNTHKEVHILAPSDDYITSLNRKGNYEQFGGTSGAAPLVTASLATFESIAEYHPTAKEAKTLLKNTAIPVPSSVKGGPGYGTNGYGMLNTYKLAMVGERLKKQCGKDVACFKQKINDPKTYQFPPPDEFFLLEIRKAFPECDNECDKREKSSSCNGASYSNCVSVSSQCTNKKLVLNKLRKEAFLNPHNAQLWRNTACIYQSAGFKKEAQGALATYKAINYKYNRDNNHLYCEAHSDCTLVPDKSCSDGSIFETIGHVFSSGKFKPQNKHAAELYYFNCMEGRGTPTACNGACRCGNTETVPVESGENPPQKRYESRCVNHVCELNTHEIPAKKIPKVTTNPTSIGGASTLDRIPVHERSSGSVK